MQYIVLMAIKILDNVILTTKSIVQYRRRKIISSVLVILSQLLFYTLVKQVISDNSVLTIILISIASGIGNYIAFPIIDKFKIDDTWENIVTSNNKEMIINMATMLKNNNIKYLLYDTYNRHFDKSLTIMAFTKTKSESRLIDCFLNNSDAKYLRMINGIETTRKI